MHPKLPNVGQLLRRIGIVDLRTVIFVVIRMRSASPTEVPPNFWTTNCIPQR